MLKINIPENVQEILTKLKENGHQAFIVGGCVRDSLLCKTPNDWDITTSALPYEIKNIFNKTIDTGIAHGTVTVIYNGYPFEVTTFRKDGEYKDSRHPESVEYTNDIVADLSRRDFTINAMAYNKDSGLIDPFSGVNDLNCSIVRCVGDPDVRFTEDALRMLRAVRFSAQLSFDIDKNTIKALNKKSADIKKISVERIREELNKILLSDNVISAFSLLHETEILKYILPEFDLCFTTEQNIKYHLYNVALHSMHVIKNCPNKLYLKYAALFHDIGKPGCKKTDENGVDTFRNHSTLSAVLTSRILRRMKMDNKSSDKILKLVASHDREIVPTKKAVKRAIIAIGDDELFIDLLNFKRAEVYAQNTNYTLPRLETYDTIEKIYYEIKKNNEAMKLSDLNINGNDIIALGYKGKEIGIILNNVFLHVINNPTENEKEKILKIIKKNSKKWLNS